MISRPSIAIIGAGAIGGYYGGRLAQHGHDVHFLLRSDYEHVRAHGLSVRSAAGDFSLPPETIHVYNDPAQMPRADLVIITLKSTENHQFSQLITPLLKNETAILTLQNGLGNEDELARLFGAERILGGMAFVCVARTAPGLIEHFDHGHIRLGEFSGPGRSERAEQIAGLFRESRVDAEAIDDLKAGRWDKQVWNIPFNGLGALLDAATDELLGSDEGVRLVRSIMEEVMQAARADGVRLDPEIPQRKIDATVSMGHYLSSTQLDRQRGRPMEIDAIFARPLEIARRAGVSTPMLAMLTTCLRLLESKKAGQLN